MKSFVQFLEEANELPIDEVSKSMLSRYQQKNETDREKAVGTQDVKRIEKRVKGDRLAGKKRYPAAYKKYSPNNQAKVPATESTAHKAAVKHITDLGKKNKKSFGDQRMHIDDYPGKHDEKTRQAAKTINKKQFGNWKKGKDGKMTQESTASRWKAQDAAANIYSKEKRKPDNRSIEAIRAKYRDKKKAVKEEESLKTSDYAKGTSMSAQKFKDSQKKKKEAPALKTSDYPKGTSMSAKKFKDMREDMEGMSQKSGDKRPTDKGAGMTAQGVAKYNRRTGGNLKTAVTTPPSKLKKGSKAAGRRKSFCARSKGWTGERGKAARRRWNC